MFVHQQEGRPVSPARTGGSRDRTGVMQTLLRTSSSSSCNTLQHTAAHCNALQRTATHCNALQRAATHVQTEHSREHLLVAAATHCNALQHNATHCNALQRTATHCNAPQHTATHCNTLQHMCKPNTLENILHGVATISRLLKIIGLFCKSAL